jgi:PAS domain S-box-containing protein
VSTGKIFWSQEAHRIFGYEPATNVTIDMMLDRVHQGDRVLVDRVINRVATHGEPFDIEYRLQMPDGSVKHLHVVAHALVDEPENLQFAGAVMDITARKETERELRHSEQRYQNLFQAMSVSFFEVDYTTSRQMLRVLRDAGVVDFRCYFRENPAFVRDIMRATRVIDVNDQTVTLFGRGSKEELLTSVEAFWPEESFQDYVEAVLASIERNQEYSTATRMRRLDGTLFDAQFTLRYANEAKTRGLAGVIDITERKQAEEALRRSEQRYRNLFHHMPVALWQLNARGILELFRQLRSEGVTDLGAYFDAHPDLPQHCMEMLVIEEVNQRTVQMLGGGDASEFVGTSIARYFPENSATFRRSMVSRFRGDPNYAAETKLSTLDGRVVDVLYTASRVGPVSEPGVSLLGVIDITERKQAEEALRRSEQRYRHLFNYMPIALQQLDARGLIELFRELRAQGVTDLAPYFDAHPEFLQRCMEALVVEEVNERTVQLLGVSDAGEVVGKRVGPSWQARPDTFRRAMESRFRGATAFEEETQWVTRDGRVVDVLFTSSRLQVGNIGISLVGATDISQRVQAFSALEKSEQRYRLLFHNVPFPLWQIDAQPLLAMLADLRAQGVKDLSAYIDDHPDFLANTIRAQKFEEINDYAVHLFGAQHRNELIGTSPWDWLKSVDILRRAVESRWRGEEFYQETTKLETRNGRVIDALFFTARPQKTGSPPITIIGVIDLTEQVRAQEELQRVRADFAHAARISVLGELTASIAHEVNQPLAAIAAGGEASLRWLARPTPHVDEVRELTENMVADARRASAIIARIRAMATRRVPEQTRFSLDEVVREALLFLRHEVESRNVRVSHIAGSGVHEVAADRTQLQQVIVNLAVNAMQAMAQAGSTNRNITIRTLACNATTLRCAIEDSGPGIEPKHVARLFDSFFTTKDSGMGMGLRICRSVIEAHGGRIVADNNSALGGARFLFTLPVAPMLT